MANDHATEATDADEAPPPEAILIAALEAERDCLAALEATLVDETAALRTLAADAIFDCAHRKTTLAERHQVLAEARAEAMERLAPGATGLTDLRARRPDLDDPVGLIHDDLRSIARAILERGAWNRAFTETGRDVVQGALSMVSRLHAGARTTYGDDGRVQTGTPRRGVERRA